MDHLIPASMHFANVALRLFALAACAWMALEIYRELKARGVRWPGIWTSVLCILTAPAFVILFKGDLYWLIAGALGVSGYDPRLWRLIAAVWVVGCCGVLAIHLTLKGLRRVRKTGPAGSDPLPEPRAGALTRRAALASPFVVAGYGVFVGRERFRLREVEMEVSNLPADLDGLRIGQITDIHAGAFLEPKEVRRLVSMLNETNPHLTLVTGDLITGPGDPLHETIDALSALRADSGVWGCMGNHEQYARCRGEAEIYGRKMGIEFLRQSSRALRFGDAELNLVGVDYQKQSQPYLRGAGELMRPGAVNLLLSHNPDVFPKAADLGFDLVISGHTHGGQITLEIVEQTLNPARFLTPFVSGLYRIGASSLYVSRGIGTVTLPIRLGAEPEVAIIRLRRA